MKIKYVLNQAFPPLAWLADIQNGVATVCHGSGVEHQPLFFAEGAWNGRFADGDFLRSDWFCGSGGVLKEKRIVFSTASHVGSSLFCYEDESNRRAVISNSLHLACAYLNFHLDAQYENYEVDFNTILWGYKKYKKTVRVLDSSEQPVKMHIVYLRLISVSDDGAVQYALRPLDKPFADFDDYRSRLTAALRGMIENANAPERMKQYGTLTMISKGYDAPCGAAIVKELGCDTAVTFAAEGKYAEDSGVEIAKLLGYQNVIERSPEDYRKRTDLPEAEQIASGELGADIQFCVFDDVFRNHLVFNGNRGDSTWGVKMPYVNDECIYKGFISHIGEQEHRLWVDYVAVPVPMYGATAWTSIMRISESEEMQPWSVNYSYNRPIPRRIVEEAGVPREMFGQQKHGAGFMMHFDNFSQIKKRLSPAAAASFSDYVAQNKRSYTAATAKYYWQLRMIFIRQFLLKIKLRDLAVKIPFDKEELAKIANPTVARYLIPWASEVVRSRYSEALKAE